MQLKIVQFEVKISEKQTVRLNETLRMQLGRYTQAIEMVTALFKNDVDQFGQKIIQCTIEIALMPDGKVSKSNVATTMEDAFYNSVSRAKRQLERQRKHRNNRFNPTFTIDK